MRRLATAGLLLAVSVTPAAAVSKAKLCKQACGSVITACQQATEALGFGTVVGKRCKKSVLKRCKKEGPEICEAFCGDGVVGGSEECDGADLGGNTCAGLTFVSGTLACGADCKFDTSGCDACGDSRLDAGEECDGSELGGATCASLGFTSGTLGCRPSCGFDTSGCDACGNGTLDPGEECDTDVPAGVTCQSLGFDAGTVACTACSIDSSGCGSMQSIALDEVSFGGGGAAWLYIDGNSFLVDEGALGEPAGGGDDAFDSAWEIDVDASDFSPGDGPDSATLFAGGTHSEITTLEQTLSGLEVFAVLRAFQISPVLRVLLSFTNPSGAPIMSTIAVHTNFGSDSDTTVEATSSGDTTVDTADRWLVTSDAEPFSDPVNTSVLHGPGSPAVTPATETVSSDSLDATFAITVPAGETRYLVFFSQLSATAGDAQTRAMSFDSNASLDAMGLFDGITAAQRPMVLNWDLN